MIQEIITYIIIASAAIYTIFSFVKVFIPQKHKKNHSCCGSCSGCSLSNHSAASKIPVKKIG